MENYQPELSNQTNQFISRMIVAFLSVTSIIFIIFACVFIKYDIPIVKHIVPIYAAQHITFLLVYLYYHKAPFVTFETYVTVVIFYLCYISVALYPIVCVFWKSGQPIAFFWYILVPVGAGVFQIKSVLLWVISTLIIIISVFFIAPFFQIQYTFDPACIYLINAITVSSVALLVALFIYMFNKKSEIDVNNQNSILSKEIENAENLAKDKALYNNIIEYMEKEQPYKNPKFSIQTLSKAMNSNVSYISKAINTGGSVNFNTMLNNYRINYIISQLKSGANKKFTLDSIHTEAGYKYRSTFNNAFKSIVGVTPSEYLARRTA